jgi:hypothetical protein
MSVFEDIASSLGQTQDDLSQVALPHFPKQSKTEPDRLIATYSRRHPKVLANGNTRIMPSFTPTRATPITFWKESIKPVQSTASHQMSVNVHQPKASNENFEYLLHDAIHKTSRSRPLGIHRTPLSDMANSPKGSISFHNQSQRRTNSSKSGSTQSRNVKEDIAILADDQIQTSMQSHELSAHIYQAIDYKTVNASRLQSLTEPKSNVSLLLALTRLIVVLSTQTDCPSCCLSSYLILTVFHRWCLFFTFELIYCRFHLSRVISVSLP